MTQPQDEAVSELQRQFTQAFELPDAPVFDDVGESPAFQPEPDDDGHQERSRDRERGRSSPATVYALEDLYAQFPEIGKGDWKLRISRIEPKAFRGHQTAGFLCEIWDKISLEEFRARFGGGVYQVLIMRPTSPNEATLSDYKTAKDVRFRVAGDPIISGDGGPVPVVSENMNGNSAVEQTRLQLEAKEKERLFMQAMKAEEKAERIHREVFPTAFERVQGMTSAQIDFWKDEATRLKNEVFQIRSQYETDSREQENQLRNLQARLVEAENRANSNQINLESKVLMDQRSQFESRMSDYKTQTEERMREERKRFEDERARLLEETNRKLSDLSNDHRRVVDEMTRRHDEERRNYESTQQLERERIREDSRYRIDQISAQKEQEVRQLRETYEQRIADLRLSTDRELQSLRDSTAREIESIRQSERAQAMLARESAEMKKEAVKAEEQRVRAEILELRRENSDLRDRLDAERAKQHKDPLTAIREIREMGAELGLVEAGSVEKDEKPQETTVSQLLGLARQAFDSAPQVMEKIMEARREQQQAALQAQAIQAQQMQAQAQAQSQAQARQQARQTRQLAGQQPPRQIAAPPAQAQAPVARYSPPAAPTRKPAPTAPPFGSVYVPPTSPVPFAPTPNVVASPLQPAEAVASPTLAESPESQLAVASAPPAVEPSEAVQPIHASNEVSEPSLTQDSGALIVKFFEKLDGAVSNKVLSPETFAIGVIAEIGPEQTARLLGQFSPQDIVETAQQISPDTAIATRDGQRFVQELWRVATEKVQLQGFSP